MKINAKECCLLLIDIQEKLIPAIFNKDEVIQNAINSIDIAVNLNIPIILTEQYPKGLGQTLKKIKNVLPPKESFRIEKTTFSCLGSKCFKKILKSLKKKQVIVVGIESHICVLQTSLDLKNNDYEVFIIDGGVGSRTLKDHDLGLRRMLSAKIHLTNIEMLIFELVRDSNHELFKYVSKKYIK